MSNRNFNDLELSRFSEDKSFNEPGEEIKEEDSDRSPEEVKDGEGPFELTREVEENRHEREK